jgi:hypothetical protein
MTNLTSAQVVTNTVFAGHFSGGDNTDLGGH